MKNLYILIVLVLVLFVYDGSAEYEITRYDIEELTGVPVKKDNYDLNQGIFSMEVEEPSGLLWINYLDTNGLFRFDGIKMEFPSDLFDTSKNEYIFKNLVKDKYGKIWADDNIPWDATRGSFSINKLEKIEGEQRPDGMRATGIIAPTNIMHLQFDNNNDLWVTDYTRGVFKSDKNMDWLVFNSSKAHWAVTVGAYPMSGYNKTFISPIGEVWFVVNERIVLKLENGKVINMLDSLHILGSSIEFDDEGNTWFLGENLQKLDGKGNVFNFNDVDVFEDEDEDENVNYNIDRGFAIDEYENIWIGLDKGRILKFNEKYNSLDTIDLGFEKSDNYTVVKNIKVDKERHIVWISTSDGQLAKIENYNFTDVEDDSELDELLFEISPNPVTSESKISFYLDAASEVELKIYDLKGDEVLTVIDSYMLNQGTHTFDLQMSEYNTGAYIAQIKVGKYSRTIKLIKK